MMYVDCDRQLDDKQPLSNSSVNYKGIYLAALFSIFKVKILIRNLKLVSFIRKGSAVGYLFCTPSHY